MQPAPRLEPPPEVAAPSQAAFPVATSWGRLVLDRLASALVRAGGFAVVLSLVGILVFLLIEVAPLFRGAGVSEPRVLTRTGGEPALLLADASLARVASVARDGSVSVLDAANGALQATLPFPLAGEVVAVGDAPGEPTFAALLRDGRVIVVPIEWRVAYGEANARSVSAELGAPVELELETGGASVVAFSARARATGSAAAAVLSDGTLVVVRRDVRVNDFTGERDEQISRWQVPSPEGVTRLLLDSDQRQLYGADARGGLYWWELAEDGVRSPRISDTGAPISALSLLVGGRSVVVGFADGELSVWFRVQSGRAHAELVRAHEIASQGAAIRAIAPSWRKRTFAALAADGSIGLYHSTSERTLWRGHAGGEEAITAVLAPRGDALYIASASGVRAFDVRNPHPETSVAGLVEPIWYEDYPGPTWVWQSTGGSEEFEPKLSLTPLAIGTLKGTFYALFFAIPLGILGALYTSQLMDPRLQRWVKPSVEIMASLPSVVLGFLAGLWLAPRLERYFPGLLLLLVASPVLALAAGFAFRALPGRLRGRLPPGAEVAFAAAALAAGAAVSILLSGTVEGMVFGGDFGGWLQQTTGLAYDQRNAVVAGVAMAFAVIPIIFAIAEESLSNVPKTLAAASLALGATRWQTLARVVLPAASPGLFAAVMIGFGRAVGETMIVLMATGNTPLLGWSPFDGFRSLSANIAVEIPEAPHGGTLYRVLFLSALLLFIVTFVLNTAADLVRESLRRRYSGN
ncbi:MAG: ABC transporter permease subunit [Myxococcota bacterium]